MAIGTTAAILGSAIIGAGGTALAAKSNSGAINKATDAQTANNAEQMALQREIYGENKAALSPFMARGNMAGDVMNNALGLSGGNAALTAYEAFKQSTGYQSRLEEGYRGVNSNYAASGMLQSGAAQKSLLRYGQNFASNEFGNWFGALGNQQGVGFSGASALAGVGQGYANSAGALGQANANALGQAAVARANNSNALIGGISNIAGNAVGALSSYGQQPFAPPAMVAPGAYGGNGANMTGAIWNYGR